MVAQLVFELNLQFQHTALSNDQCYQAIEEILGEEDDSYAKEDVI